MKIVKVCLIEILALIKDQLISIDGINDDVILTTWLIPDM